MKGGDGSNAGMERNAQVHGDCIYCFLTVVQEGVRECAALACLLSAKRDVFVSVSKGGMG